MDRTTFLQGLTISIIASYFDTNLLTASKTLDDFIHQYHHKKENFDLQERHTIMDSEFPNKNSF